MNTPIEELRKMEKAVHKKFGPNPPTKAQVVEFLKKHYAPKMDGGLSVAIALALKYAGVASLILSGYKVVRDEFKGRPPKCPVIDCGKRAVRYARNGMAVCSNGHRWRPQ